MNILVIFGLGSLGSYFIRSLVTSLERRPQHVLLSDPDTVELHNLLNQPIYTADDVGLPKTEAASRYLAQFGIPSTIIPAYAEHITDQHLNGVTHAAILVDSLSARRALHRRLAAHAAAAPAAPALVAVVDAGVAGDAGHVRPAWLPLAPCLECSEWLFPPPRTLPLCSLPGTPRTPAHCVLIAQRLEPARELARAAGLDPALVTPALVHSVLEGAVAGSPGACAAVGARAWERLGKGGGAGVLNVSVKDGRVIEGEFIELAARSDCECCRMMAQVREFIVNIPL